MAKFETVLNEDFDCLLEKIENGILNGSYTASLEEKSDFYGENSRCSVRAFERYSYSGQNRVSLTVTLFQSGDSVQLSAVCTGGTQGVLFKFNTIGEDNFLEKLKEIL